ncbi:MAG TPA: class I SAM-dependent methyltransferase, partial [Chitinophaga sp.]|uniref:class I SAM-dependent methyltransferase n=1 Tax=Chitinophaga sp. TaxID=1869181 RepID=UPI002CF2C38A
NDNQEYLSVNKALWNQRISVHVTSDFYDVPAFLNGKSSLNSIELELLGNIQQQSILHLQCHFGQDTLSMARMGASVTGADLSDAAIEEARKLAAQLHLSNKSRFVCCDLYSLPAHLRGTFNIVFTSYGTIGWLPDLSKWAAVVNHFLEPGGQFIMADFHPVVWMFDSTFTKVGYGYFNTTTIVEKEEGTYADPNAGISNLSYSWNHPLSDIITALTAQGLQLQVFREYDYSPYNCFSNTTQQGDRFYIKGLEGKLPMVYALKFIKPH